MIADDALRFSETMVSIGISVKAKLDRFLFDRLSGPIGATAIGLSEYSSVLLGAAGLAIVGQATARVIGGTWRAGRGLLARAGVGGAVAGAVGRPTAVATMRVQAGTVFVRGAVGGAGRRPPGTIYGPTGRRVRSAGGAAAAAAATRSAAPRGLLRRVGGFAGKKAPVVGLAIGSLGVGSALLAGDTAGVVRESGGLVGGWGGAVGGAAIGTAIAPGPGTLIGGIIGGVAGNLIGDAVGQAVVDASDRPDQQRTAQDIMQQRFARTPAGRRPEIDSRDQSTHITVQSGAETDHDLAREIAAVVENRAVRRRRERAAHLRDTVIADPEPDPVF